MARKTRLMFHQIRAYDLDNDTCMIREMEMIIDHELAGKDSGHIMQFWQDVKLYGLDEALLYLVNGELINADQEKRIAAKIAEIKGVIYGHADTSVSGR